MAYSTKVLYAALYLSALVSAEDFLYSKRHLNKRFIDERGNYNMSFYHVNDVHAHLDEFRSSGTDCVDPKQGCYGGYARIKAIVDQTRPTHNDSLFFNVGDEFQGTLFYSFYGGEKIAETCNQLGFDGMVLGNHEFDAGDDKLGAFLENLTFPIISANIQSDHPILNSTIKPFKIYEKHQLAVIGVTTEETSSISNPGKGTRFSDPVTTVQATIDYIKATTNITRFAAITHIGYEEDKRLAAETTGLHLIMGGHSHTLLGDSPNAAGKYPTIVDNKDGEEVFIVTAHRWGEYLGYIDVAYDAQGKIIAYHGAPIHLTNTTNQDPELQAQIDSWRGPFEAFSAEVIGKSAVELDHSLCRREECVLGNVMADAMLEYRLNVSDTADFALLNGGGVRATIPEGNVTRGHVLTAFPFGNALVEIPVKGDEIWKTLEGVYSELNQFNQKPVSSKVQVSRNIKITWNANNPNGTRLVDIKIDNKPFSNTTTYNVVTVDFLATGGDNIFQKKDGLVVLDSLDEILVQHIKSKSPIRAMIEGRIVNLNGTNTTTPTSSTSSGSSTPTRVPSGAAKMTSTCLGVLLAFICATTLL